MRILACFVVALSCVAVQAGDCANGRCQLNRPVASAAREVVEVTRDVAVGAAREVVEVTRDVAVGTAQVTRNVAVGTVRAVTPPYRGRCTNGRCRVR